MADNYRKDPEAVSRLTPEQYRVTQESATEPPFRLFLGMQDLIRKFPGVVSTRVGYTGGDVQNATYSNHKGHAEAIEIIYDPAKTSYRDLLEFVDASGL
jgi:hypothetical protein